MYLYRHKCTITLYLRYHIQSYSQVSVEFVIIGVHTPEFIREKELVPLRKETARLGIDYAVVTDNEYQTWDRYHQQYWPTMYLIEKKGLPPSNEAGRPAPSWGILLLPGEA